MAKYFLVTALTLLIMNHTTQASGNDIRISQITVAVNDAEAMRNFYEKVFQCTFRSFELQGHTLYSGTFAGIDLVLCPNEIPGVVAEQNRHQFDIVVPDLEKALENVKAAGGKMMDEVQITERSKVASIIDPDGNTMVLIQKRVQKPEPPNE
jgi:predicted enzyme related to lactoylglutathione lyase